MYTIDDKDTVVELHDVPQSCTGAPCPAVISDEFHVLLAYIVSEPDPNWDGSYVNVVGPDSGGLPIAVVTFTHPYAHMFGPPNDEAFSGHPLADRGLRPYSASEIIDSSWVRCLERMNSVHHYHNPDQYAELRHLIFAFHDSTFECVAKGYTVSVMRGSIRSALERMATMLNDDA